MEKTDLSTLISSDDDTNSTTAVFSDYVYVTFCISKSISAVAVKERNEWMNGTIWELVAERCQALFLNHLPFVHRLKSDIMREIRYGKSVCAKTIESDLKSRPSLAWKPLNNI